MPGVPDRDRAHTDIVVVDYGIGNLKSVRGTLERVGADVTISDRTSAFLAADGVVLPGVGAFGRGVDNLAPVRDGLLEAVDAGQPLLGICLGMQLLMTSSEEAPGARGLGLVPGTNRRFSDAVKVPHMGWNTIEVDRPHPVLAGIERAHAYFVHSYYPVPDDDAAVVATASHDVRFPAVIAAEDAPVVGTQFHPEKSGDTGVRILDNFANWCHPEG